MSFEYAMHEISYANLLMYCSTLPSYDYGKDKKGKAVNADDPRNNAKILAILNGKMF